ncbi:two component transcriptional regulator, LuxR family protein [Cupriavidus basilensis OR16]|uniref:Two component transcriptional regulator, LuxR family protein n=1 Tax=Cupriavidus basilensis OR16 TaxID=1127483 RepID=H1S5Q5_9BURK|nr:two component transcriptional regulator, LuxR family protein [Cupriavidus basilensis OR16]
MPARVPRATSHIVIADDHPVVLVGLRGLLAQFEGIEIVGSARNSTEILTLLSRQPCDVLLTDYVMPGGAHGDGLRMIELVRRRYPALSILVVTMLENPVQIGKLVRFEHLSVVSKLDDASHITAALAQVLDGVRCLSPTIQRLLDSSGPPASPASWQRASSRPGERTAARNRKHRRPGTPPKAIHRIHWTFPWVPATMNGHESALDGCRGNPLGPVTHHLSGKRLSCRAGQGGSNEPSSILGGPVVRSPGCRGGLPLQHRSRAYRTPEHRFRAPDGAARAAHGPVHRRGAVQPADPPARPKGAPGDPL